MSKSRRNPKLSLIIRRQYFTYPLPESRGGPAYIHCNIEYFA